MEISENRIVKADNGIELQLVKEIKGLFIAINYGKLCDKDKYLVEPYTAKDGETYIHVIKRLKPDISVEEQVEMALKEKDDYEEIVIIPSCSTDEDKILYLIREVLEDAELYYIFENNLCPCFCVIYEYDNMDFIMTIQYLLGIIDVDIPYPVEIPVKYRGIIALYVCENNNTSFGKWSFDIQKGTLSLGFSIMTNKAENFEKSVFQKQLQLALAGFFNEADQMQLLCKGKVSKDQLILYSHTFMNGLISMKKEENIHTSDDELSIDDDRSTCIEEDKDEIDKYIDRIAKGEKLDFKEVMNVCLNKEDKETTQISQILPFVDAL